MTASERFGRLEQVELVQAWAHEARDFTPWLASNLDRLSEALGFQLELEGQEVAVESFSADILARNVQDGSLVLIENQFQQSDHGHLGQIMTYLAGLEAHTVVWIAPRFREPHLSAIRWLNEHTEEPFAFFAVELRVVRIGSSPMVPVFEIVERPNAWDREVRATAREKTDPTEIGSFRRDFWAHMMRKHPSEGDAGRPYAASSKWRPLPDLNLVIVQYLSKNGAGIFVRCPRGGDDEAAAELVLPHERELEQRLDVGMNAGNPRYLLHKFQRFAAEDRSSWDRIADWLKSEADRYEQALRAVLGDGA